MAFSSSPPSPSPPRRSRKRGRRKNISLKKIGGFSMRL
jgi:hypothetical protein